jgi:Transposase DDE domain
MAEANKHSLKSCPVQWVHLTSNGPGSGDGEIGKKLMGKIPKNTKRILGDGAYDGIGFRRAIEKTKAEPIIPPPKDAIINADSTDEAMDKRNQAVAEIKGLGGDDQARKIWKILKGYHRRSLAETTMYRIKQLTGGNLRSREWERQCIEGYIKCLVVNKMTKIGMPEGIWEEVA